MPIENKGNLYFTQNWYGETSKKNLHTFLIVNKYISDKIIKFQFLSIYNFQNSLIQSVYYSPWKCIWSTDIHACIAFSLLTIPWHCNWPQFNWVKETDNTAVVFLCRMIQTDSPTHFCETCSINITVWPIVHPVLSNIHQYQTSTP